MKKFLAIPALLLAVSALGGLVVVGGCKQGQGDRCQVKADCDQGLTCNQALKPPVCQAEGNAGGIDALPPLDAPDAPDAL